MKTVEEINELKMQSSNGTSEWHKYPGLTAITDGILLFCQAAECFWLLDLIASYQPMLRRKHPEDMQIWILDVDLLSHTGQVRCACEDDAPPCVEQTIDFTDFPLSYQVIYVGSDGIACLPEEY